MPTTPTRKEHDALKDGAKIPRTQRADQDSWEASPHLVHAVTRSIWQQFRRAARNAAAPMASLGIGLALWEVLGRTLELRFLPPFGDVAIRLVQLTQEGVIMTSLLWSLQNLALGYFIASTSGLALGIAMARLSWLEEALNPYVYALLTTPTVVFVPVYFSIFGLSRWAIVGLIVQYAVFITTVNTVTAVKHVDRELLDMAAVFGATKGMQLVRKVILPAALPLVAAGLRLAMGRAVKGMINGEILIAVIGLGGLSSKFGRAFDAEGVMAILLVVIGVALVAVKLVQLIDNRVNFWLPKTYR